MKLADARRMCRNPRAVWSHDGWIIVNTASGEVIESARDDAAARRAAESLNDHEVRNGRIRVYDIQRLEAS